MGAHEYEREPESAALWDALGVAVAKAHELLDLGVTFGWEGGARLQRDLRSACGGTTLGVGGERATSLRERQSYLDNYIDMVTEGRSVILNVTVDGEQRPSPPLRDARRAYRTYALRVRALELSSAAKIGRLIGDAIDMVEPEHAPDGLAHLRAETVEALERVVEPLRLYCESTRRMQTVRRLGGYSR